MTRPPGPLTGWRRLRFNAGIRADELKRAAVMRLPERTRWRIAAAVDRVPGQCWSGLVDWVLSDDPGYPWRPWSPDRPCRDSVDLERCGSCYCGKLRKTS